MTDFEKYFDHTLLSADATLSQVLNLCDEAKTYGFYSVCVNSSYVAVCNQALEGTDVKVASVVGFPLGAMDSKSKAYESKLACQNGAAEIDMVINIGRLKDKDYSYVVEDIKGVKEEIMAFEGVLKVIIETCLLTDEETVKGCQLALEGGADFVKTSTGFSTGGATVNHVTLMKTTVGDGCQVKASGGIRNLETALAMIEAGATRLGTSATTTIVDQYRLR